MAVAEMSVMTLIGLKKDENDIFDEIQKCGAAQIRSAKDYAFTESSSPSGIEEHSAVKQRIEKAVEVISACLQEVSDGKNIVKDGFGITKAEFFAAKDKLPEVCKAVERTEEGEKRIAAIKAERSKTESLLSAYEPYLSVDENFSAFKDTKSVAVYLGTVGKEKSKIFIDEAEKCGLNAFTFGEASETVALLVAHKTERAAAEEVMSKAAMRRCQFDGEYTAREKTEELNKKISDLTEEENKIVKEIAALCGGVRDMKICSDYLSFLIEKAEADGKLGKTQRAFVMEAYVPTEMKENVESAVRVVSDAVFVEFESVPRDEFAPTLSKNNKIVRNFEAVTDMYSSPAYGALDPNAVMSFFFSLFMGVIMADVGYGILMILGGFLLAKKQREGSSLGRMARVFAYGGIFAVLFGALFDSWLGYPLLRNSLGEGYNAFYAAHLDQINAMTSIAGIDVPAILMWCLALGTIQIGVGLILKAVQDFGRGKYIEGFFGGIVWAIVMFSFVAFIYGVATDNGVLSRYGGYVTIGALAVGVLTAGIAEKGFGKVLKVFTSLYGLINYVSDILSYARLYGLMLSGAQIASIFTNTLAIDMLFPKGPIGVIFGIILIVVGNVFNLAINLLGAYIHDARLQYVEFFGKFYEGEGELFSPFGNKMEHTYFTKN